MNRVGLGGGCHWCTEAVFQGLKGVKTAQQGWLTINGDKNSYSEGVLVDFDPELISLEVLISIHLYTHSCTSDHPLRGKYRSGIYVFDEEQRKRAQNLLDTIQEEFNDPIITQIYDYDDFKLNEENFLNYYQKNPEKPFCQTYINPKFQFLMKKFSKHISDDQLERLEKSNIKPT